MCATIVIDHTPGRPVTIVSQKADPTNGCVIAVNQNGTVSCDTLVCAGECVLHGPTVLNDDEPWIMEWKCCCEGIEDGSPDSGSGGCGGCGDAVAS